MSSSSLLQALTSVAGTPLRYVGLIKTEMASAHASRLMDALESRGDTVPRHLLHEDAKAGVCYVCLAQDGMIFLDRAMYGRATNGMFIKV